MKNILRPVAVTLFCVAFTSCGGGGFTTSSCTADAFVSPPTATADHMASPPGNQVQFSGVVKNQSGSCPLPAIVFANPWTTSDQVNTSISNQPATAGLATCLNATPSPAIIGYLNPAPGGKGYTSATLTCD